MTTRERPRLRAVSNAPSPADDAPERFSRAETVSILQGICLVARGIARLAAARTADDVRRGWLARVADALVAMLGGALVLSGFRRRVTPTVAAAGAGTAAVLAGVDVFRAARRRISPVRLGGAAADAVLLAGWASAARGRAVEASAPEVGVGAGRRG